MNRIRRLLRSLLRSKPEAERAADRRTGGDRRSGQERRAPTGEPLGNERRSGADRRSSQERRSSSD
jgi:hypothetical protein